jgi:lipopolysaccharide export system permease protein
MQFFWLYIDDLVGKGLDNKTVFNLIFYLAPTLVPLALPLGILLASIMTFGNKAESSELTAIKSAGISLRRLSLPLVGLMFVLSCLAFLFNNFVIPFSNKKFTGLLTDIRNTKPAVNIKAGSFYSQIPGYSIYISQKESDNKTIRDILIYDHTSGRGNDKMIRAKKGEMYVSNDQKYLIFELYNGTRYEDKEGKDAKSKDYIQLDFKYWKKIFDLSSFEMKKDGEEMQGNTETSLNNSRISGKIDTINATIKRYCSQNIENLNAYLSIVELEKEKKKNAAIGKTTTNKKSLFKLSSVKDSLVESIFSTAASNIRSIKSSAEIYKSDQQIQNLTKIRLQIEWHRKLSLAASCLILFLIGAPLGAIIRKGGFGMPFVAAVSFFVINRFLNVGLEKYTEQGEMPVIWGMWLPNIILCFIAIIMFHLANIDSPIFAKGYLIGKFKSFISKRK